ncbi:glycosyltransferase family 39 protein [Thermopirellula anaerolimosa]
MVIAVLLIFGLTLRILHWSPSADGDEARYINHAYALAEARTPDYFDGAVAVRLPYLGFLAGWGSVFGTSTPVLQASGLLTFCANAILLWAIAYSLYGAAAAHIATALFSLLPIHIKLSTHCLTDDLGLVFALASILCWLNALELANTKPRGFYLLVAISGFLAGIATAIRQPFFLLGLILPIGSLLQRHSLKRCGTATLIFALTALSYFTLECVAFYQWLDKPAFRFSHDILQSKDSRGTPLMESSEQRPSRATMPVLQKLFYFRGYLRHLLPSGSFGIVPALLLLAITDRWAKDRRRSILLSLFVVALTVYHFWGTTSPRSWNIPPVNARYLIPVMAVGCILIGAMLDSVHQRYRFSFVTALAAYMCILIFSVWQVAYGSRPNCVTEFAQYLSTLPADQKPFIIVPESVKRCFLPKDYWHYLEGMPIVSDSDIATIERLHLSNVQGIAVPNETFYTYAHIGVVDALERTADWWTRREVIGNKWPRYLEVTGKPSDRTIGFVYYRRERDSSNEKKHP